MTHRDSPLAVVTIVSGGQTGADRAALDFAIEHRLPHDGWCPRGRRAEDGPLDLRYQLRETASTNYEVRTRQNVEDSDGTAVFSIAPRPSGGTALTLRFARESQRPLLHLARNAHPLFGTADAIRTDAERLCEFLVEHQIRRLNIAGPRGSQEPTIGTYVWSVLASALASE
ncbi:putative molybdenum carrier protein [Aeoliella mucimassa]|uniref:Molybdenum carrier n=1 Tax=Aeoliella mucimassa TaxID=2527972 RepID=A0A518AVM0_9BACT|nr:putative molybdenum carrier protein [Aeoliella mucimassa]QDU58785.1 Putative molybdenum carrier [Aeoliella mucimassa]